MKFKTWVRVECEECYNDEDWDYSIGEDVEDLMAQASACGWGIYQNKQLCPKCMDKTKETP